MGAVIKRLLTIGVLVCAPAWAQAQTAPVAKQKMAVMPLQVQRGVDKETAAILGTLLVDTLQRTTKMETISADDINAMLGFERMKDVVGCDNLACSVEISGALGVDYLVSGKAMRLGKNLVLTLALIDAKKGSVKARAKQEVEAKEDLYALLCEQAVARLYNLPVPQSLAGRVAAPPVGAPAPTPEAAADGGGTPWRTFGVSKQVWEEYERYRNAARAASSEPLEFLAWQEHAAARNQDWIEYFAYCGGELDSGKKPTGFDDWYTDTHWGTLVFQSEPAGAQITLAGEVLGRTPLVVKKPPDTYRVNIELEDYEPQVFEARARAGTRQEFKTTLMSNAERAHLRQQEEMRQEAAREAARAERAEAARRAEVARQQAMELRRTQEAARAQAEAARDADVPKLWGWGVSSLALLGAGTAVMITLPTWQSIAIDAYLPYLDNPTPKTYQAVTNDITRQHVQLVVGPALLAAGVVTGIIYFTVLHDYSQDLPEVTAPVVSLQPGGAVVGWSGSF